VSQTKPATNSEQGALEHFCFVSDNIVIFTSEVNGCIEICPIPEALRNSKQPGCLITTLSLGLPKFKDSKSKIVIFSCNSDRPINNNRSSCIHADGRKCTPASFQAPFEDGLVVFTLTIEYPRGDGDVNETGLPPDFSFIDEPY
jgi:hypothetical protein